VTTEQGSDNSRLPIALVVATAFEARIVERSLSKAPTGRSRRFPDSDFAVVRVGVSCCAMDAVRLGEDYSAIVSTGFAGALVAGVESGTIVEPDYIVTTDVKNCPVDPTLQRMLSAKDQQATVSGPVLHTDRLLASVADKQQAFESSQCIACDMESGILGYGIGYSGLVGPAFGTAIRLPACCSGCSGYAGTCTYTHSF